MSDAASNDLPGRIREDLRRRRAERRGQAAVERGLLSPAEFEALWKFRPIEELDRRLDALDREGGAESGPPSREAPALLGHRYRLLEKLGEGAMSVVHRALDQGLGRPVAVKLLRESAGFQATGRERFLREARTLARRTTP